MSENLDNEIEPDFDEWLSGGERKAHFVTLYARADLYADIEELERQKVVVQEIPEEDRPMGGAADPNRELQEQIDALWVQLGASKKEFRVSSLTREELEALREAVKVELKDTADTASSKARTAAKETAKRLGMTATNDVNLMVRTKAAEAYAAVINREVDLRAIADSTTMRRGDGWVPLTIAQMRAMTEKLGGSQLDALNQAYSRAANEAPVVNLPK